MKRHIGGQTFDGPRKLILIHRLIVRPGIVTGTAQRPIMR